MQLDYSKILNNIRDILFEEGIPSFSLLEILLIRSIKKFDTRNMRTSMYIDSISQNVENTLRGTNVSKKVDEELDKLSPSEIKELVIYATKNGVGYADRFDDSSSEELSMLVIKLFNIIKGRGYAYCDVGCGKGSFLLTLCKYLKDTNDTKTLGVFGIEYNYKNALIAQTLMNICCPEIEYFGIRNDDVLEQGLDKIIPINKAFVYPPFGMRVKDITKSRIFKDFKFTPRNGSEIEFLDKTISRLSGSDLKAVAILPSRVLINSSDKKYIYRLIKSGWVEGIIELPVGSLKNVAIKSYLFILSPKNNGIKMLNSTDFIKVGLNRREFKLPYNEIYEKYQNLEPINISKLLARKPGCEKLTEDQWIDSLNFEPSKYNLEQSANKDGKKLEEIADVFPGCKYTIQNLKPLISLKQTNYQFITSSNIIDEEIDWKNLQYINPEDDKFDKYIVHKGDIVMTSKSSKTKIALIQEEPKFKTIVTGGMIIIRPNAKLVNPIYLAMYLRSNKGQNSILSIQRGSVIISISYNDVKRLIIPLKPISEQNDMARKYEYKWANYLALKVELELAQDKIKNIFDFDEKGEN